MALLVPGPACSGHYRQVVCKTGFTILAISERNYSYRVHFLYSQYTTAMGTANSYHVCHQSSHWSVHSLHIAIHQQFSVFPSTGICQRASFVHYMHFQVRIHE